MKKLTDEDVELVGLENLDPKADDSEMPESLKSDAVHDSPGDDAILIQEEIYNGLSSDVLPSDKAKGA